MHFKKLLFRLRVSSYMVSFKFIAIGTHWTIDVSSPGSCQSYNSLEDTIKQRIEIFENTYSRFRENSLPDKISKQDGEIILPSDAKKLFDLYFELEKISNGLVSPVVGNTLVEAGYDKDYSFDEKKFTKPLILNQVLSYEFPKLFVKQKCWIDFGALGKGYLIDIVGDILESFKIEKYTVEAGGDMYHKSSDGTSIRVGLEHPLDTSQIVGFTEIKKGSICASAGNRRRWKNFHHIINPITQKPVDNILATWVVSDSAIISDALTTMLFFVEPEVLVNRFRFDYLILYPDLSMRKSNSNIFTTF